MSDLTFVHLRETLKRGLVRRRVKFHIYCVWVVTEWLKWSREVPVRHNTDKRRLPYARSSNFRRVNAGLGTPSREEGRQLWLQPHEALPRCVPRDICISAAAVPLDLGPKFL